MRFAVAGILILAASGVAGCASTPDGGADQPVRIERGPPPSYEEVAATLNARAKILRRVWAYATIHVWWVNDEGKQQEDQLETLVMLDQPDRVYMRFRKATVDLAILGCDERQYWWIDLGKPRQAWVGSHDQATPERMARFAMPIHPLDFVQLLGMAPVPTDAAGTSVAWSDDGRYLIVETPSRFGRRRVALEPRAGGYDPAEIELLDHAGRVTITARLTKYEPAPMPRGSPTDRVPKEVHFRIAGSDTRARFRPRYDSPLKIKDRAFDREQLFKAKRIDASNIVSLDDEMVRAGDGG